MDHAPGTNDEPPSRGTLATQSSLIADVADPARGQRWEEFDRTYRGVVLGMARKAGLSHHDAEDVTQDVFTSLVRSLVGFELGPRRGSFRRYLFQLVRWRVASKFDQLKRAGDEALTTLDPGEADIADPQAEGGPSRAQTDAEFRTAVIEAMLVLARDLRPCDLQMLELYYCQGWKAERIAKALGGSTGGVHVVAHRHKLRLCREIRRRL